MTNEYLDCIERICSSRSYSKEEEQLIGKERMEKRVIGDLIFHLVDYINCELDTLIEENIIKIEEEKDVFENKTKTMRLNLLKRDKFVELKNMKESDIRNLTTGLENAKKYIEEKDKRIKQLEKIIMEEWCLTDISQIDKMIE